MSMTMTSHPILARHARLRADRRSPETFLLSAEQALLLNGSALAIVRLCTGEHTVGTIIDRLRHQHPEAPPRIVAEDVLNFLRILIERGLMHEHMEA